MFSLNSMSLRAIRRLRDLFCMFGLACVPAVAHAAPGDVDLSFNAGLSYGSSVEAFAIQADGKILFGNDRLFANGARDPFYAATSSMAAQKLSLTHHWSMRPQVKDGSTLILGWFHADGPVSPSTRFARFSRDGHIDMGFNVDHLGSDSFLLPRRDGKIFAGGGFLMPGESTLRGRLLLLNEDGSVDPSFAPVIDRVVRSAGVQGDGKVIIIGEFNSVNGTARPGIARLDQDGTLDTSFAPVLENRPLGLVVLPDGDILLPNISSSLNGSFRYRTVRVSPNGTVDSSFSLITNDRIGSMAVQTDGSIVLTGSFSTVNETARSRLARITFSGALDTSFRSLSFSNGSFYSMSMQADGAILVSGSYSSIGGVERPNFTRLQNGTGSSSFVQLDANTLRWMRSGALPEIQNVISEVFSTAAGTWVPLGPVSRITGGWEISGNPLPVSGTVRTRGLQVGSGAALIEGLHVLGGAVPDLAMRDKAGDYIPTGMTVDTGKMLIGYAGVRELGIGNQGAGILDNLNVSISGPAAADFKVIGFSPKVLAPGDALPFEVSFSPSATGERTATLVVSSNDPDLPSWSITLSGQGTNRMDPVFNSVTDVPLRTATFSGAGKTFGNLTLGFAPAPGTILRVLDRTDNNLIDSFFDDLPDGSLVSATFGGQTYVFIAGYRGGGGNDLTLTLMEAGAPSLVNYPDFGGSVSALAVRPDGSMLIAGNLNNPGNTKNRDLLMLSSNGTLIESFRPRFIYSGVMEISKILPYPDGRFLVFGGFDSVNEIAKRNIVRFNADGTVDPSFGIGEFPYVVELDLLPDGKLLAMVHGNAGHYITRYDSNGDTDGSFTPSRTMVTNFLRLRDGKILINGDFGQDQGYRRLLRLEPDGNPDASFNPPGIEYYSLGQMMEQKDGRVLVITNPGNSGRALRRFHADGSLDDTFQPYFGADSYFKALVEQADGKLIVGGNFSQLDGFPVNGVVRMLSDGTPDPSFGGSASQIDSLAMLANGEIIATGGWIGGVSTIRFCRLLNDGGEFSVGIPQPGIIRLSATGAVPDLSWASFSVLPSGGSSWTPLSAATRVAGGWELSGQALPSSGVIRWVGRPSASSVAMSMIEGFVNFGSAAPAVELSGPDGIVQPNGSGSISFGRMFPGRSRVLPITVKNNGDGIWNPAGASISGSDAGSFTILDSPQRGILPGETGKFLVSFTPEDTTAYSASLSIFGNQTVGNPQVVQLSGTGSATLDPLFHSAGDVQVTASSFNTASLSFGTLQLGFVPTAGTQLRVINNTGTELISGMFGDLADGSVIQAVHGGTSYDFLVGYRAGDGNDLVLTLSGAGVPVAGYSPQVTGSVSLALPIDDGGTLLAGEFTAVNGIARTRIAKLDAEGGVVADFAPAPSGSITSVVGLPGGEQLLAGLVFPARPGTQPNDVARLTGDGTMKPLARTNEMIRTMVVQSDGRILIGGRFSSVNGVLRRGFARLHPSGVPDLSFNPLVGNNASAILLQPDGRILVAAPSYTQLSRLLPTGEVDASFTSPFANNFLDAPISAMVLLPDGRIIIGGSFVRVGNVLRSFLARLHPDGSLDTSFRPLLDARVRTLALQADGNIIAGGDFTEVNDVPRNRIARIRSDGSVDATFDSNLGGSLNSAAIRKDGRVLIAGEGFSTVSGVPASRFAMLDNQPAVSSIHITPGKVTWLRGGTAPEAVAVTFDIRGAGDVDWQMLGEGVRVSGGWELATSGVPAGHLIRARARVSTVNVGYEITEEAVGAGSLLPYLAVSANSGEIVGSPSQEIDFGMLPVSSGGQTRVRITNLGTAPLVVSPPSVEGAHAADFAIMDTAAITLPVGGHAFVSIRFTPSSGGSRNALVRFSSNDPAGDVLIPLKGEGGGFTPFFADPEDVPLSYTEFPGGSLVFGGLRLGFAPAPGMVLTGAEVSGTVPVSGNFAGLADQSFITASYGGKDYRFLVDYRGGDGNDLVFILDGPAVAEGTFAPGPNSRPNSIAVQDDGKILISGSFTSVGGNNMGNLVRLFPDGTPDTSFPVTGTAAESMAVQLDGKILVAADVAGGGHQRLKLARLNRDGTIDTSFQANITGTVARICVLRNGKILIGGPFTRVDSQTRTGVALLNPNGSLDTNFTANLSGASQTLYAMAEQPDGKLLLGGWYTHVGGYQRTYLSRVSATGVVDTAFNPQMTSQAGGVSSIAVQPDGKIVLGGYITGIGGAVRNNIARLNQDGAIDAEFAADADQPSTCIRVQADGKIMVSGLFGRMNGVKKNGIARLHADGTLDRSFNVMPTHPTYATVYTMVMGADGGLLIGGNFNSVGNRGGANFAKLGKDELVSEVEAIGGAKVRWTTGGALTEMHSTTFEVSTNGGTSWSLLGEGNRVEGGWGLQGISLPQSGLLRARGTQILTSRVTAGQTINISPFTRRDFTALEAWRDKYFEDAFDSSVDLLDSDHDGVKNIVEFALGLLPHSDSSGMLPPWILSGDHYVMGFIQPAQTANITYSAEWSATLREDDWHPAEDLSVGDAKSFRVPVGTEERKFFRLRVLNP